MATELVHACALKGDLKELKEQGEDIHAHIERALILSAIHGHIEVIKYLVTLGTDIRVDKELALTVAATNGHLEIVKYFVSLGADIHADNEFALKMAASCERLEVVEYLVSLGADIQLIIKTSSCSKTIEILKKYIEREIYKGQINETTELECGICLTEMDSYANKPTTQCKVCKKCVHLDCEEKWSKNCVYCRN